VSLVGSTAQPILKTNLVIGQLLVFTLDVVYAAHGSKILRHAVASSASHWKPYREHSLNSMEKRFSPPRRDAGFVEPMECLGVKRVYEAVRHLRTERFPFVGLPESTAGRWGQGLTAEKMKECVWVKPDTVAEIEFLEWTGNDHLRHTKFVCLSDDKDQFEVVSSPWCKY
jgi:hypothetical protein